MPVLGTLNGVRTMATPQFVSLDLRRRIVRKHGASEGRRDAQAPTMAIEWSAAARR